MSRKVLLLLILYIVIIGVLVAVFRFYNTAQIAVDPSRYGSDCKIAATCGDLVGVNCRAEVDGPYYYVRKGSGEIVSTCGGACMTGCTNCPPKEWTCRP